jgi:hypothetical protein
MLKKIPNTTWISYSGGNFDWQNPENIHAFLITILNKISIVKNDNSEMNAMAEEVVFPVLYGFKIVILFEET